MILNIDRINLKTGERDSLWKVLDLSEYGVTDSNILTSKKQMRVRSLELVNEWNRIAITQISSGFLWHYHITGV